jgi:peptidoglycan/xylan/chitin deacetylase (PgdA/CDA1 family)
MAISSKQVRGRGSSRSVRVLQYHSVVPGDQELNALEISLHTFQRQITWLRRWGFTSITILDYLHYLNGELDLPRKPVIITFDGVSKSVFENAVPILKQFGMRAVYFVLADTSIRTLDSKNEGGWTTELLTNHQILELRAEGNEIGSLTISYPGLTTLNDAAAWEEISRSRVLLEILLNAPVKSFAYPQGMVSDNTKKMVVQAGYSVACSVDSGPPLVDEDLFEVRRIRVGNSRHAIAFWFQLQNIYLYFRWLRWIVKSHMVVL